MAWYNVYDEKVVFIAKTLLSIIFYHEKGTFKNDEKSLLGFLLVLVMVATIFLGIIVTANAAEGEPIHADHNDGWQALSEIGDREEPLTSGKYFLSNDIAAGGGIEIGANQEVTLCLNGKVLFEKIYLYRPTPVKIEGDIYTFECSANQVLYYFERFGDSALILSPKRLGISMRNY